MLSYKDKDNQVKREPLAVARYVEENMYAMNIMKPDPYSVPIMYTTNVRNPDALLGYNLALGHAGIDKLKSMVEKGLIKGVKHAISCDRACLCLDCLRAKQTRAPVSRLLDSDDSELRYCRCRSNGSATSRHPSGRWFEHGCACFRWSAVA